MTGRLIAIGDIHGCSAALDTVLEAIAPQANDIIVTLGDYCDRGKDTRGVIDRLLKLRSQCQVVNLLGNHEIMMLAVVRDGQEPRIWLQYGGVETLDSYGFAGDMNVIPEEHLAFLNRLDRYYETDDFIFVHANYDPELPLAEQPDDLLHWVKLTDYLPPQHRSGKHVIVGHTHDRGGEIFKLSHLTCIDTHCYGGGWLTALDVRQGTIWQANRNGQLR